MFVRFVIDVNSVFTCLSASFQWQSLCPSSTVFSLSISSHSLSCLPPPTISPPPPTPGLFSFLFSFLCRPVKSTFCTSSQTSPFLPLPLFPHPSLTTSPHFLTSFSLAYPSIAHIVSLPLFPSLVPFLWRSHHIALPLLFVSVHLSFSRLSISFLVSFSHHPSPSSTLSCLSGSIVTSLSYPLSLSSECLSSSPLLLLYVHFSSTSSHYLSPNPTLSLSCSFRVLSSPLSIYCPLPLYCYCFVPLSLSYTSVLHALFVQNQPEYYVHTP